MVRGIIVYPEVDIVMRLKKWNSSQLSKESGINYCTLRRKLSGKSKVTLTDAINIKKALEYTYNIERLFKPCK